MRTFILISFALLLTAISSCKKDQIVSNKISNGEIISGKGGGGTPQNLTLGQTYGGGYIFHIDGTGQHGLIVSPEDLIGTYPWAPGSIALGTSAISTDGYYNTKRIIQVYGNVPNYTRPYAALAAKKYNGGGFTDWYLPSYEELAILSSAASSINLNFSINNRNFWSSTEDITSFSRAFTIPGVATNVFDFLLVRPIRKF